MIDVDLINVHEETELDLVTNGDLNDDSRYLTADSKNIDLNEGIVFLNYTDSGIKKETINIYSPISGGR